MSHRYGHFFEHSPDAVVVVDAAGRIVAANDQAGRLFGYTVEELVGSPLELLLPEDRRHVHAAHRARYAAAPYTRPMGESLDLSARRADGTVFPVDVSLSLLPEPDGDRYAAAIRDVTARRQAEDALRVSELRFRSLFELAPVGMAVVTPGGRFSDVNPALCRLLGYDAAELATMSFDDVTPEEDVRRDVEQLARLFVDGVPFTVEKRYLSKRGAVVWAAVTVARLTDSVPLQAVVIVNDITARRERDNELLHRAMHDPLTGLANRGLLTVRLAHALARSRRTGEPTGVAFVDLDMFKEINDRFGHQVGDEVLREIATRVSAAVRPTDTVGRVGGDEFVVVFEALSDGVEHMAERLRSALARPIACGETEVTVTASVGVAVALGDDDIAPDTLIARADEALYRAKAGGRDRVERWVPTSASGAPGHRRHDAGSGVGTTTTGQ